MTTDEERKAFEAWEKDYAPIGRLPAREWMFHAWQARAALAPTVPPGWKLVPIEPTPEMVAAMAIEEATGTINGQPTLGMAGAVLAYESMLDAAPQPKPAPTVPTGGEFCFPPYRPGEPKASGGDLVMYSIYPPSSTVPTEPVAWGCFKDGVLQIELIDTKEVVGHWIKSDEPEMQGMTAGPLFASPPQRKPLTEEQIVSMAENQDWDLRDRKWRNAMLEIVRAIEAAHGIGESA